MPNKRIDQLPGSGNQLKGDDLVPIFSDGKTERISVDNFASYSGFTGGGTDTNGIFDISNSGNTVPLSFEYNITDSIQQNGPESYLRHDGRFFRFVGEVTNDRTYVISQSNATTAFAGPVFMLANSALVGVSQRIDLFLENNSSGTGSTTNMNFRRQNISGNGSNWIDFITQDGNTQNVEFNSAKSGSANYGDVIVKNGNFVIKNLGTGTTVTNLGVDANGTLVSGSSSSPSYKIFTAIVTDFGFVGDPQMTILENTLGVTPTISYEATGSFRINATEAFPIGYTTAVFGPLQGDGLVEKTGAPSADYVNWFVAARGTGSATDGLMLYMTVEIKVFTP